MADWPIYQQSRVASVGQGADSRGTQVTSSGTANTKGSWTQLAASTPFAAHLIVLHWTIESDTPAVLLDIGVGASGSEQIIVPDLYFQPRQDSFSTLVAMPVGIPAGARVAVRTAASSTSVLSDVALELIAGGSALMSPLRQVTAYGANSATSGGVLTDAGGTANVKGAWAQVTASTTSAHKGLLIAISINGSAGGTGTRLDVAVGGSGSEQIIIPDFQVNSTWGGARQPNHSIMYPVDIPAGSRLAIRSQCGFTDATLRQSNVVLYGFS